MCVCFFPSPPGKMIQWYPASSLGMGFSTAKQKRSQALEDCAGEEIADPGFVLEVRCKSIGLREGPAGNPTRMLKLELTILLVLFHMFVLSDFKMRSWCLLKPQQFSSIFFSSCGLCRSSTSTINIDHHIGIINKLVSYPLLIHC